MIDLDFSVVGAEAVAFSALPTLALQLRIDNRGEASIRAISLATQVRIGPHMRSYADGEQQQLVELFGERARWGQTLRSLLWTMTSVQVPAFQNSTTVALPIACTYDFEVVSAKYFAALQQGVAPLELLFSGTVFYASEGGLQVEQISWDKEAHFDLPVALWREVMDRHFPNAAWMRVQRETFDRLRAFQTRKALLGWDAALACLLDNAERAEAPWTR